MDAIVKKNSTIKLKAVEKPIVRPSREEAEEAVRTMILWAGDNPEREGESQDKAEKSNDPADDQEQDSKVRVPNVVEDVRQAHGAPLRSP